LSDFQVTGAEQFEKLARNLKAEGEKGLRQELNAALKAGAKPLIEKTRAAAVAQLPKRGGLNQVVARSPMRISTTAWGKNGGVRLVAGRPGSGARGTDEGHLRHRVFATDTWVVQKVTPGWFTVTAKNNVHQVLPHLEQALNNVGSRVTRL
jgi:hypothetical protein